MRNSRLHNVITIVMIGLTISANLLISGCGSPQQSDSDNGRARLLEDKDSEPEATESGLGKVVSGTVEGLWQVVEGTGEAVYKGVVGTAGLIYWYTVIVFFPDVFTCQH